MSQTCMYDNYKNYHLLRFDNISYFIKCIIIYFKLIFSVHIYGDLILFWKCTLCLIKKDTGIIYGLNKKKKH